MIENVKQTSERLLDIESSRLLLEEDGIASITFYQGDLKSAIEKIKQRAARVVEANPWLVGRLIRDKREDKNVQLFFPQNASSKELVDLMFHPSPASIQVGSNMPYKQLYQASESAVIKKGIKSINQTDVVSRLTIVPDRDNEQGFALIFSISHIAADGYTYYKIFNSLFSENPIETLQPKRHLQADKAIRTAVGAKQYDYLFSPSFILNAIKGALFGQKAKCFAYYLDSDKIADVKSKVIKKNSKINFVSTNDIITSSFIRATQARLSMTAINLRSRVDSISPQDAGNYEAALLFDHKVGASPEGIRETILNGPNFEPTIEPLPNFFKGLTCNVCIVTNWAGFTGNLFIQDCEQQLHLPLHATNLMPFDCAIIFEAKPGQLAMLVFAKRIGNDTLKSSCEVGQSVSTKIFSN